MRLATFNIENLFTRHLFARGVDRHAAGTHGFTSEDLRVRIADPDAKRLTADVVRALNADVLALQEVEDLEVLKQFRDRFRIMKFVIVLVAVGMVVTVLFPTSAAVGAC